MFVLYSTNLIYFSHEKNFFMLVCFLELPLSVVIADNFETEIYLLEICSSGNLVCDNPLDGPSQTGEEPTRPNDFHAYISGKTLSVTSEATSNTQIRVVNRQTNQTVVNRQFSSFDSEQLPSGLYSIELQCGNLLLVGQFQAE